MSSSEQPLSLLDPPKKGVKVILLHADSGVPPQEFQFDMVEVHQYRPVVPRYENGRIADMLPCRVTTTILTGVSTQGSED